MKKRSSVPRMRAGKDSETDTVVNISLTKRQFLALLKAVYLGEYVTNGYRLIDEADPELREIDQIMLSKADELGFSHLVEYDAESGKTRPRQIRNR